MRSAKGVIEQFSSSKGFGSILGDDGTTFIIHRKCFLRGYIPRAGDPVTFEVTNVPAGLLATNVAVRSSAEEVEALPIFPPSDSAGFAAETVPSTIELARPALPKEASVKHY